MCFWRTQFNPLQEVIMNYKPHHFTEVHYAATATRSLASIPSCLPGTPRTEAECAR